MDKLLGINGEVIGYSWSGELTPAKMPSVPVYMYDENDEYVGELEGVVGGKLEK